MQKYRPNINKLNGIFGGFLSHNALFRVILPIYFFMFFLYKSFAFTFWFLILILQVSPCQTCAVRCLNVFFILFIWLIFFLFVLFYSYLFLLYLILLFEIPICVILMEIFFLKKV